MRAAVIVHDHDMAQVQGIVMHDDRLSADVFTSDDCSYELCVCHTEGGGHSLVLTSEDGQNLSPSELARRYSTIIVVAADYAVNSRELRQLLSSFLQGTNTPGWSNEAVIILRMTDTEHSGLHTLSRGRVFHVPGLPRGFSTQEVGTPEWIHYVKAELEGLIATIGENQTRNPNVGFGVLLVDGRCNFFLMERLREPGRGSLGTIGGNFDRGRTVEEQLRSTLRRRFHRGGGPDVELGPLLACTNMQNSFLHYVDLTFLAIISGGSVDDVSDEQLSPLGPSALQHIPGSTSRRNPRLMFSLSEVAAFHGAGLLFTPVANAFESLCRTLLADQLRYGRQRTVYVSSLLNESRMPPLELPEDIDSLRRIVTAIQWSPTAIPFFEGEIS
jgi:hypothetical protein